MPGLRAAVRRFAGRRTHLERGYHILTRSTDEIFPLGGPVSRVTVTAFRNGRRFTARAFTDRLFVVDEMVVGGQYLIELGRLRRRIEARALDGCLYVVDAGANVGLFTLFASLLLRPPIHCDGFEPFGENLLLCRRNWSDRDFRVHPEALSDEDGRAVSLYLRSSTGATIMTAEPRHDDTPFVTVHTARLDTLWAHLAIPRVDLVKLDIEGAEENALGGAVETIARHRPFILCSYEHEGNDPNRLVELIRGVVPGYAVQDDGARRLLTFEPPLGSESATGFPSSGRRRIDV